MTDERYRARGQEDMWFQQDGVAAHTERATTKILKDAVPGRLIYHFGSLRWTAKSPDMNTPDFFLWGFFEVTNLCQQATDS